MPVSKFIPRARVLYRRCCCDVAAQRLQKCAGRAGDRRTGGDIALPYYAIIREAQDWSVLSQIGFLPPLIWTSLSARDGAELVWLRWLWIGLVLVAIARCVTIRVFPDAGMRGNTAALFAGTALIAG